MLLWSRTFLSIKGCDFPHRFQFLAHGVMSLLRKRKGGLSSSWSSLLFFIIEGVDTFSFDPSGFFYENSARSHCSLFKWICYENDRHSNCSSKKVLFILLSKQSILLVANKKVPILNLTVVIKQPIKWNVKRAQISPLWPLHWRQIIFKMHRFQLFPFS